MQPQSWAQSWIQCFLPLLFFVGNITTIFTSLLSQALLFLYTVERFVDKSMDTHNNNNQNTGLYIDIMEHGTKLQLKHHPVFWYLLLIHGVGRFMFLAVLLPDGLTQRSNGMRRNRLNIIKYVSKKPSVS